MSSDTSTPKKDSLPEDEVGTVDEQSTPPNEDAAKTETDSDAAVEETAQDTPATETPPQDDESSVGTTTGGSSNQLKMSGLIVLLALVVAAGVWFALQNSSGVAGIDEDKVVASVNGVEITEGERQERLRQIDSAAQQQGRPAVSGDPMVREQVLDELVNLYLLEEAARGAGVEVTEDEIEEQFATLKGLFGGPEGFQAQVEALGLTEEQLRTNVTREILITKYIETTVPEEELAVTDEEVQDVYDNFVAQNEDAPSFEEVSPQIAQQLEQQKSSLAVQELITELRADAEVELFN